jgi:hypothetical protein
MLSQASSFLSFFLRLPQLPDGPLNPYANVSSFNIPPPPQGGPARPNRWTNTAGAFSFEVNTTTM